MFGRGEKVKFVGDIYDSNIFITENNKKHLIVDAGASVDKLAGGVNKGDVVGLLLTHGHFDHSYFALDYAKEFNIKIYASDKIKEYLSELKKNYSTDFDIKPLEVKDFSNFIFLNSNGEVEIEGVKVKFFQMGGHSKSDMCFLIGDDLYVGDLIIGRGIGRMDLYGGNRQDMLQSLKALEKLEYKTMHCGHGEDLSKEMADKVIKTYIKFLSRTNGESKK